VRPETARYKYREDRNTFLLDASLVEVLLKSLLTAPLTFEFMRICFLALMHDSRHGHNDEEHLKTRTDVVGGFFCAQREHIIVV
jgi:hypothetical protein